MGDGNGRSSDIRNRIKLMQVEKKNINNTEENFDYTTLKGFIKGFINGIKNADVSNLGAQLAYFFLLSLFPLLLFILALFPYLNLPQTQMFSMLENILPKEIYTFIKGIMQDVLASRNSGLLSVGIIATLWSASKGVNALVKSLNKSYGIVETRPFIIARGMSLIFTVLLIILLIIGLLLPVFGQSIGMFLENTIGLNKEFLKLFTYIRLILPSLLIVLVLVLLYWIMPNRTITFKNAIPGAIFSAIGWGLVSFGFSFYISHFANYSKTYGSIGGIIILMLWLYIIGIVLIVGGLLNAAMQKRKEQLIAKKSITQKEAETQE